MLEKKHDDKSKAIAYFFRWDIVLISIFLIPLILDFLMLVIVMLDGRVYFDQFQGILSQLFLIYLVPLAAILSGYISASVFADFTSVTCALIPDICLSFIWNIIILLPFLGLIFKLIYIEDITAYINSPIVPISQSILNLAIVHFFVKGKTSSENNSTITIKQLIDKVSDGFKKMADQPKVQLNVHAPVYGGVAGNVEGNQVNAPKEQKLTPAETTAEIQVLVEQLSKIYPTNTTAEKMVVAAEAIKRIESDPTWKQRVINAAREGGLAALEKVLDNPIGALITGAIRGWLEAEAE